MDIALEELIQMVTFMNTGSGQSASFFGGQFSKNALVTVSRSLVWSCNWHNLIKCHHFRYSRTRTQVSHARFAILLKAPLARSRILVVQIDKLLVNPFGKIDESRFIKLSTRTRRLTRLPFGDAFALTSGLFFLPLLYSNDCWPFRRQSYLRMSQALRNLLG